MSRHSHTPEKKPPPSCNPALTYAEQLNYMLYDIANAVHATRKIPDLCLSIFQSLNSLITVPNFFVARCDTRKQTLSFEYIVDEFDQKGFQNQAIDLSGSLIGEVLLNKRPMLLKTHQLIERAKACRLEGTTPKIWLGVPLIVQDRAAGVMAVQHYSDPGYFTHKHLEILVCIAELLSMAMERNQLAMELETEKNRCLQLAKQSQAVVFQTDGNGICNFANPQTLELLNSTSAELYHTSFFDLIHPEDVQTLSSAIERRSPENDQTPYSVSFRIKTPSGRFQLLKGTVEVGFSPDRKINKLFFIGQTAQNPQIHSPEQKTILIIEDEPAIRTMAAKAIHSFGYQTLEAEDGEKGIALFETGHASIDAILLDIILPKMSGIQTFEKILHIDPDASIIITSGHITNQDQKSMFAKARGFLEKPYQIMELKKMIHLALD